MNLIEAIKTFPKIRRINSAKHKGSNGTGWLSSEYILTIMTPFHNQNQVRYFQITSTLPSMILSQEDILAEDWEGEND